MKIFPKHPEIRCNISLVSFEVYVRITDRMLDLIMFHQYSDRINNNVFVNNYFQNSLNKNKISNCKYCESYLNDQ